jgi:hypothetical protein
MRSDEAREIEIVHPGDADKQNAIRFRPASRRRLTGRRDDKGQEGSHSTSRDAAAHTRHRYPPIE